MTQPPANFGFIEIEGVLRHIASGQTVSQFEMIAQDNFNRHLIMKFSADTAGFTAMQLINRREPYYQARFTSGETMQINIKRN